MEPVLRVLVVDDHAQVRKALRFHLEMHGIQVDEAGDGVEALEQLDGKSYGLVITDYRMPRLNGLALIAILQKTRQGLPILFLAGTLDPAEEHCARTYGAFSILRKPVSHALLLDTVWAAVRPTPSLSGPLH